MDTNVNPVPIKKQFSTFECMKGLFLYLYRVLVSETVKGVWEYMGWWWRLISTREDLFVADIPLDYVLQRRIDNCYFLWNVGLESILLGLVLGIYFGAGYGLVWALLSFVCRAYQAGYYKRIALSRIYTLPGAVLNTRQIFRDNWNWLMSIGADEMERRETSASNQ